MTPTIVLPDGDPHMAALLTRPDFAARLDRLGGARLHADLPSGDDELSARIGDATVVILGAYLTGPVLRRLPKLRLVSFTGTGAATFVDLPAAADCGIAVANVARYGDAAVAEHALALTLALAKRVVGNDRAVRAGEWHVGQGIELAGKTAGIVGYGGIGARLADLLEAIGMQVIAWTPHPDPGRLTSTAQRFVALEDLLASADVVSLHLLLTDDTRGMIDEAMLRSLKPGALLVNTARAELIAPGALERVLAEGRIAAALDVFETEPLAASSTLRDLPNAVLSPHQAYNTPESLERMLDVVVANIEHYLSGTPANIVSAAPHLCSPRRPGQSKPPGRPQRKPAGNT
jgi:D-3-phosphoglycerate dehydrogenase / 2-oxoglutarate reductase